MGDDDDDESKQSIVFSEMLPPELLFDVFIEIIEGRVRLLWQDTLGMEAGYPEERNGSCK